jgi:hypothetical protein
MNSLNVSVGEPLRLWIRDHRVCWEIGPLTEHDGHASRPVGLELRLFASHAADADAAPGCAVCVELHQTLRAVALLALPEEPRPSRYEFEPFDSSFHMRPESGWRPEVQLVLRIVHGHDFFAPVDECERRCAAEIQDRLRCFGVQPRAWRDPARGAGHAGGMP